MMDRPQDPVKGATECVNPREQGLSASDPFESVKSESNAPKEPTEDLLKISKDMTRVLERLTAPKASIYVVRRHGAEEFHGTSLKESNKAEVGGLIEYDNTLWNGSMVATPNARPSKLYPTQVC